MRRGGPGTGRHCHLVGVRCPKSGCYRGRARSLIHAAIDSLPPSQREVVTLRDSEGWSAEEVCNILQISETNQRVLLHRGRSRVRRALEQYLTGT